ncbi:hypothetical protein [uncultured Alistipes sp.]|uniref:hypothetical protein n=1 Tax=uncultured Alistipes sp. TaxID=538949 RepID=UPI00262D829C|nr:hypothetical protein [uncultured Alistipes sp.]
MKKLFLIAVCATMVMGLNAQTLTLPNGKSVPIRLTSEIQSNSKAKNATTPAAIVDANIQDDNGQHILIRRGTPVEISATIQKAKGVGKGAYIKLDFLSTRSVDGQLIRLQGNLIKEGQNRKGTALGVGLGVGLTVCWPCLFCLCIKGEKLTIPENTLVNNVVTNDVYQVNVN